MAIGGFLFGGNTGDTYDSLQRRRKIADALAAQVMGQQPKNTMEGVGAVLKGLGAGVARYRTDKAEDAGKSKANELFNSIMGGSTAAPAYGAPTASMGMPGASAEMSASQPQRAGAPQVPPDQIKQLIAENVPPEMQAYATNLVGKESSFNPTAVSPTGATGLAQFTRGTGKQYGLVGPDGDQRADPVANLKALVALTNDNRNALTQALGRAPTDGELALAHQQGVGGAISLLSGKGVDPRALAVNGVNPGTDPRQAAQQIMGYYGGSGGTPAQQAIEAQAPASREALARGNTLAPEGSISPEDQSRLAQMRGPAPASAPYQGPGAIINAPSLRGSQGAGSSYVDPAITTAYQQPTAQPETAQPPMQSGNAPMPVQQPQRPQQVAQAAPQAPRINPQYLQLLANPWISEDQKAAVRMMIQQDSQNQQNALEEQQWRAHQDYANQQRASDPQYQLTTQKLQQDIQNARTPEQLEAARRAAAQYDEQQRENSPDYKIGLQRSQVELDNAKNPVRPITADERKMWGIPESDTRAYMMTPNEGPRLIGPAGQTINIDTQVDNRKKVAEQMGLKPDDPRYMGYILNGELPKENQQSLTAVDKKAIQDADDMVAANQNALSALSYAEKLSPEANSGWLAGTRAAIGNNLPDMMVPDVISSPESSQATTDMDNAIVGQALSQLKTIFGGNPTEGERAILLQLQGSSSMPAAVRAQVFSRARELAGKRLKYNQDRANDLRGGTYYKPTSPSATSGQAPAPNVDDLLKKYGGQ